MKRISLYEIKNRTSSPEAKARNEKISIFVQAQANYQPGRKRPKDPTEERILNRFMNK